MAIVRLYGGEDGESHFEDLALQSHPQLKGLQAAKGVQFRETAPGFFQDWHHAPRRQFVITLSGEMEVGLGDGTVRRFGPGDVVICEDLTGRGHTMGVPGSEPHLIAMVPF